MYRLLNKIEILVSKGLGKGYGAHSVAKETQMLKKFLDAPRLGIDIGGNKGEYASNLRLNFPKMEIHIFEPAKVNNDKLTSRFSDDPHIFINQVAVSDQQGSADLFSDVPGSGLGSLTKRNLDHFGINFDLKESVRTIRFEDYWKSNLLMRDIDIAKIDVEGNEYAVLMGFGEAIKKIKVIQFEFGGCNIDTRIFFRDFWYFFKNYSFKIYRITPFGLEYLSTYRENDETFLTTNFLCVNQSKR